MRRTIIDIAQALTTDFSHEELANHLESLYGYDHDQMEYETPQDDWGEPDYDRVRVVVYSK